MSIPYISSSKEFPYVLILYHVFKLYYYVKKMLSYGVEYLASNKRVMFCESFELHKNPSADVLEVMDYCRRN